MDSFAVELDALQVRMKRSISIKDVDYIRRAEFWGRACSVVGFATAWCINPVSIVLIAIGQLARWAIAHHILHRAFDNIEGVPNRFRSGTFARGWRRLMDWNEWMLPAGFQHEHNVHHVYTGGDEDPDVVEANVEFIRQSPRPRWVKYLMILTIGLTWRLSYYAPGTFIQLRRRQKGLPATRYEFTSMLVFKDLFLPFSRESLIFWMQCILPCGISRFVLIPSLFLPLGLHFAVNVLVTLVLAEMLTNFYTFLLIASSHTGNDIYRFDVYTRGRSDFYRHQFLGTVNYKRGPLVRDWLQAWVNYQIEHHIFPNLPPSKYPECAGEVEEICKRHNVPYRSEYLRKRCWRMIDVVVGNATMPHVTSTAREVIGARRQAAVGEIQQEPSGEILELQTV